MEHLEHTFPVHGMQLLSEDQQLRQQGSVQVLLPDPSSCFLQAADQRMLTVLQVLQVPGNRSGKLLPG